MVQTYKMYSSWPDHCHLTCQIDLLLSFWSFFRISKGIISKKYLLRTFPNFSKKTKTLNTNNKKVPNGCQRQSCVWLIYSLLHVLCYVFGCYSFKTGNQFMRSINYNYKFRKVQLSDKILAKLLKLCMEDWNTFVLQGKFWSKCFWDRDTWSLYHLFVFNQTWQI